jgi:hypothetical protein
VKPFVYLVSSLVGWSVKIMKFLIAQYSVAMSASLSCSLSVAHEPLFSTQNSTNKSGASSAWGACPEYLFLCVDLEAICIPFGKPREAGSQSMERLVAAVF